MDAKIKLGEETQLEIDGNPGDGEETLTNKWRIETESVQCMGLEDRWPMAFDLTPYFYEYDIGDQLSAPQQTLGELPKFTASGHEDERRR